MSRIFAVFHIIKLCFLYIFYIFKRFSRAISARLEPFFMNPDSYRAQKKALIVSDKCLFHSYRFCHIVRFTGPLLSLTTSRGVTVFKYPTSRPSMAATAVSTSALPNSA